MVMSIALYAFTCGALEGELGRVMEGAEGRVTMPIRIASTIRSAGSANE